MNPAELQAGVGRDPPHLPPGQGPFTPPHSCQEDCGLWGQLGRTCPQAAFHHAQQAAQATAHQGTRSPWEIWGAGEEEGGGWWEGEQEAVALLAEAVISDAVLAES